MDTNPRPRIFVSSIMTGYGTVRAAASRGIERAGCEPVLAENFPAGTVSPRTACLDGVASRDGIASILGDRYGEPTAAGISATEEEYLEAVRLKKHIFVFLEGVDREPRQQEFVRSVEDYVDGHWRKSFRTSEELEKLVEQALREGRPMVPAGNAEGGSHERIGAARGQRPDRVESIAWAQVAWTTPRNEEVVDPTSFMDTGFQREVQRLAHEGDTPLFDHAQAKDTRVEASRLRFTQGIPGARHGGRDLVVVDLYENGTLSVALNVTGLTGGGAMHDIGQMYRIDPNDVSRRLQQSWSFAARCWEHHDPYRRHEPLLYNTVLHDVGTRRLEVAPQHPTSSVTIPGTTRRRLPGGADGAIRAHRTGEDLNGSQRAIGFDRKIRLVWLDATAEWVAQGMPAAEIRSNLDLLLEGEVTGEAARKKTKGVLLRTWLLVPEDLQPLRDEGLALLTERSGPDKLLLHWGMVCANYPVVWEVASVVGRLLSLQGSVSLAQLRRRAVETYGERSTLIRASQRIIRSFVDWSVLVETQDKGVYLPAPARSVSDEKLTLWLVEAVLRTTGSELGVLTSILGAPALFPFRIEPFPAQLLEQSSRLELYRQNRDEDLVALHSSRKRE